MKYAPLFKLDLAHAFYAEGRCPDFMITPAQDTQRMLNKYQCMVRIRPAGILVIAAVDDRSQPRIPLPEDAVFRFHLYLQNADFALFTDLSNLADQQAPLYTNATLSGDERALVLTSPTARQTERFVVAHPEPEDRFVLSGRPLAAMERSMFEVTGAVSQIDAYDPARKLITVNTQAATEGAAFQVSYPIRPPRQAGVFADVEIHNNASLAQGTAAPSTFTITFRPKEVYWTYYFVTNLGDDPALFQIQDKDAAPISFGAQNRTYLNEHPDPNDTVAAMLADQYPEMKRIRFVSDEALACRQLARKNVQLIRNGDVLIHPLPNPSFRHPTRLNGTRHPPTSLTQVVKYITHTFSTSNT